MSTHPEPSAAWLGSLPEWLPDALLVVDARGDVVYVNGRGEELFGYRRDELLGRSVDLLVPDSVRARHASMCQAYFAAPVVRPMGRAAGLVARRKDGTEVPVDISLSPVRVGAETFAIACVRDVSERLAMLRRLAEQEQAQRVAAQLEGRVNERTALLAESQRALQHKVQELEEANREIELMQQFGELLRAAGQPGDGIAAIAAFVPRFFPDANGAVYLLEPTTQSFELRARIADRAAEPSFRVADCEAIHAGRPPAGEHGGDGIDGTRCGHCANGGSRTWCLPIAGAGQIVGVLHLAVPAPTERKLRLARSVARTAGIALSGLHLREALQQQALRDPLTGVYNRRYMEESLAREIHRARRVKRPLSLLLFDLDHFKRVNDTHGHAAGDACLVQFAALLGQRLRKDDVLCRYGGEEFVVVLPECSAVDAAARAEAIRQAWRSLRVVVAAKTVDALTVSCGAAEFPADGANGYELLQAADRALYRAKETGRDRVVAHGALAGKDRRFPRNDAVGPATA